MKIVYTGPERGGVFAPGLMNHVFLPGDPVEVPDKPIAHEIVKRPDFEVVPDEEPAESGEESSAAAEEEDEVEPKLRGPRKGKGK
ncbi:hypothetical protein [Actinopolyspora halophila]|uniref:hypothetical protein n=1 Tax=Actinopolyspora halophila TaxID=1850 RepID=UPI00036AC178|nr:hypothetical protein [Actinopolyspora halophila]